MADNFPKGTIIKGPNWPEPFEFNLTDFDPEGVLDGYVMFYEGEIKDGTGSVAGKRLFSFYVQDQKVRLVPASMIWDVAEASKTQQEVVDIEQIKSVSKSQAIKE